MSFYQAGTEDLVEEWVSTCNYWAARRSRPPLQGGVSNMEYGWNRVGDSDDRDDTMSVMSNKSGRSRIGTLGRRSFGNLDKIHINDWKPAQPTLMPSKLDEEAQLETLQTYTKSLVADLEAHKGLEEPMKRLVSFAVAFTSLNDSLLPGLRTEPKRWRTGKPSFCSSTRRLSSTRLTSARSKTRSRCG